MNIWLYACEDWGRQVFILVRSKFLKSARLKVMRTTENLGLHKWSGVKLDKETSEKMLKTHDLNVLYEADNA